MVVGLLDFRQKKRFNVGAFNRSGMNILMAEYEFSRKDEIWATVVGAIVVIALCLAQVPLESVVMTIAYAPFFFGYSLFAYVPVRLVLVIPFLSKWVRETRTRVLVVFSLLGGSTFGGVYVYPTWLSV